jgi:hypothetical protein
VFAPGVNEGMNECSPLGNFSPAGLPDGLFSDQKYQFGKIFRGLILENADIFPGHLEYFIDIGDIL